MSVRRGALICATGAIDMALWDIRSQAVGEPLWRLLRPDRGAPRTEARPVVPSPSLLATGHTVEDQKASLIKKALAARAMGFRATKLEVVSTAPTATTACKKTTVESSRRRPPAERRWDPISS